MSEEKSTDEKKIDEKKIDEKEIEKEEKGHSRYTAAIEGSDEIRDISYLNRSFSDKFMQGVHKLKDMVTGRKKILILFAVAMCVVGYLILNNMRVLNNYEILTTS